MLDGYQHICRTDGQNIKVMSRNICSTNHSLATNRDSPDFLLCTCR